MYSVDLYARVRRACHVDGMSERAAARHFGIDRKTVSKILKHSIPPGYQRSGSPSRPKLDGFTGIIDQILTDDKRVIKKQRHTAKRIFERLRDEHGFTGKLTIVTDYVREKKRRTQEVFVPLSHKPGHAQVDFGETLGFIGGVECKLHYFAMSLPHSDAFFMKAYPAETTEAFCDGHNAAFAFFGGIPLSILYDNTTIAVAKILGPSRRCYASPAGRRTASASGQEPSPNCNRIICSKTSSVVLVRATTRVTLKAWLAMAAGTFWFPRPGSTASMS